MVVDGKLKNTRIANSLSLLLDKKELNPIAIPVICELGITAISLKLITYNYNLIKGARLGFYHISFGEEKGVEEENLHYAFKSHCPVRGSGSGVEGRQGRGLRTTLRFTDHTPFVTPQLRKLRTVIP